MVGNKLHNRFSFLDETIESMAFKKDVPIGLATGKLGFCIYFYFLSRHCDNKYKKIAERLLKSIYTDFGTIKSIDPRNGLPGIALGFSYLIDKKYVNGDINTILKDIDDYIFLSLTSSNHYNVISQLNTIYLLIYLVNRYKRQKANNESQYLMQELIIHTINLLYQKIDLTTFEEPPNYQVDYPLPLFLYALSSAYHEGIYNHKIIKILEEFSPKILSTMPILHANRLYLLWGMGVSSNLNIKGWSDHIKRLRTFLNVNTALTQELVDKNIFFKDGFPSIYMLLHSSRVFFDRKELSLHKKTILDRISNSEMWILLKDNPDLFSTKTGLYDGYCGVSMFVRMTYKRDEYEN